jgi:DNA replication protein DnaC
MAKCRCGEDAVIMRSDGGVAVRCEPCNRDLRMYDYFFQIGVSVMFRDASLSDYKNDFPKNIGLFLTGPAGTGKTHLAVALAREDIRNTPYRKKLSVSFTTMIDLLSRIKRTFSKDAQEKESDVVDFYCNVENLYIDDIGVEQASEWALSLVYHIIDYRWANEKRTTFTSNFDLDSLSERLDPRISSRIGGMCEIIVLSGKDRRSIR